MVNSLATLLGDVGDGLGGELGHVPGLPRRQVAEAVTAVLDIDLGSLALDGWSKYGEIRAATHRSMVPDSEPQRVELLAHRIVSTHQPSVDVYIDGARVATFEFELEVEIGVHGLDAEITSGRLTGLRSGDLDVHATLSMQGRTLAERERTYEAGALLPLGDGIPLATPVHPTTARARPRRTAIRGVLAALALALVFGLGGVTSRTVDWTSFWPQAQGTAGVVRPGTAWFVRSGPSRRSPDVATVAPGQPVRVACLDQGWARLLAPHEGRFVYSRGLTLDATPPPCRP